MNGLDGIPLWLAVPVAGLVMLGATLTVIGAWGFVRLKSFYDRLHAPTLATSWGTGGVILASALLASYQQERTIIHELVVGLGIMATVPVTLMLLGRAALHRDRLEGTMPQPGETPQSDPQMSDAEPEIDPSETGVSPASDAMVHADPHQADDAGAPAADASDPGRSGDDPVDGRPAGPGPRPSTPADAGARQADPPSPADARAREGGRATPPADPPQERS